MVSVLKEAAWIRGSRAICPALGDLQADRTQGAALWAARERASCAYPCRVWISPNHLKAIWKVFLAESWLAKKLFSFKVCQILGRRPTRAPAADHFSRIRLFCILKHARRSLLPSSADHV